MARACVLLAPGFEEIEAITVIDVLRRAEIETVTASVAADDKRVKGSHDIVVEADTTVGQASAQSWDLVVLPGGMSGATTLRDDPSAQAFIAAQHRRGGGLAAICAGPIALQPAGVTEGKKITSYPGLGDQLGSGIEYREASVVHDGTLSTSRGPGTAMEFALHLVERLRGPEARAQLKKKMLVG